MKKIISLISAAAVLIPLMQLSAAALAEPVPEFRTVVVANREKAEPGDVVEYYIKANINFEHPLCGLSFNLDIPEDFEFVDGSFTVNESNITALGLDKYDFDEDSDLPYFFYASSTSMNERSDTTGECEIARFKCRVDEDAEGVYSVNTVNNTCVYIEGERAERADWRSDAAVVRVNVPDSEPLPPEDPSNPSETGIYRAYIGFADADWDVQSWDRNTVIKEGENSLTFKLPHNEDGSPARAEGVSMLVIDMLDCLYTVGYVRVTGISVDGEEISFNGSKIIYGADDHSDKDNYRIEIFSYYGDTVDNSPIKQKDISFGDELTVNFVVSSDRTAEDDRMVYGRTIAGRDEDGEVPLEDCKIRVFNDNGAMVIPTVTGDKFDIKLPRGHYSISVSKQGYVTHSFEYIDIGKTIPECLKCIELNVYGDVNGDTAVDVEDAVSVIMHTIGSKPLTSGYVETVADTDFNGEIDIVDVATIMNQINGISVIKK